MTSPAATAKPARVSTKPIAKRQFGNISVSVFAHDVSRRNGETFTAKDYVLQKSYKDSNGDWQTQSLTLKSREIIATQQALVMAFVDSYENDDE